MPDKFIFGVIDVAHIFSLIFYKIDWQTTQFDVEWKSSFEKHVYFWVISSVGRAFDS